MKNETIAIHILEKDAKIIIKLLSDLNIKFLTDESSKTAEQIEKGIDLIM